MPFVLIFLIALTIRLWFNFGTEHINFAFNSDGYEYLCATQALEKMMALPMQFWVSCIAATFHFVAPDQVKSIAEILKPAQDISMVGPAFPLFMVLSYKIFGKPVSASDWWVPVFTQSILSSISCLLIALIGRSCWNKKVGFVAGLLAALYPGFIINSGRLFTESFACFLGCFIIWQLSKCLTERPLKAIEAFGLGLAAFALQATRSVMVFVSVALLPIVAFLSIGRLRSNLIAFFLGFILLAVPWLMVQNLASGKSSVLVDRHGKYNLFIGNNADTQGWLSFPFPDTTNIESKSTVQLVCEAISKKPGKWLALMIEKPARLYKMPWNDFRYPIGPISDGVQVILHQLLLLLAALGVSLALFPRLDETAGNDRKQIAARAFLLSWFLVGFVYVLFIAMGRYAFLFMPSVILFAAAAIVFFFQSKESPSLKRGVFILEITAMASFVVIRVNLLPIFIFLFGNSLAAFALVVSCAIKLIAIGVLLWMCLRLQRKICLWPAAAMTVTVIICLFSLPALCFPLRIHGRWYEAEKPLNYVGQKAERTIRVSELKLNYLKSHHVYVMLNLGNGTNLTDQLTVTVNGIPIDGPYIPAMALLQNLASFQRASNDIFAYEAEKILDDMTVCAGLSNLDLRQWYLIPLTTEQLEQIIERSSSVEKELNIAISVTGNGSNTLYGAHPINEKYMYMPDISRFSWEKALFGVESENGFTDPAYDLKTARIVPTVCKEEDKSSVDYYMHFLAVPKIAKTDEAIKLLKSERLMTFMGSKEGNVAKVVLNNNMLDGSTKALWLVRLSGKMAKKFGNKQMIRVEAVAADREGKKVNYICPWFPRNLAMLREGAIFDYSFPVMPQAFPGSLDSFVIRGQSGIDDKQVDVDSATESCFKDVHLRVYQLPNSLIERAHAIY